MSEAPTPNRGRPTLAYVTLFLAAAALGAAAALLIANIAKRQEEGRHPVLDLSHLTEDTVDPEVWGRTFPFQYSSYLLTADTERTSHGGSEAPGSKLEANPRLVRLFAGYPFAVDYREKRGHAYMLADQDATERVTKFKQPGACLHCHSSVLPAYREAGGGDIQKGFEAVCAMPLSEARKKVSHPVSCLDCHDPKTMQLRVTRPAFLAGIAALARGDAPVPHLPSITRWRESKRAKAYDPNADASRQEMRSFVCGQCHVEYYFKGPGKIVTYPWARGLKADDMEAYYEAEGLTDWTHGETGAKVLKAQHPELELWSQGIHARSGVACADCHMPYVRQGAMKLSSHHVRSPMLSVNSSCQTCHRFPEQEIRDRVAVIQGRTRSLLERAEKAVLELMDAVKKARAEGADDAALAEALKLHRKAQWRVDFINAESSLGFHAPQEAARVLAEGIDLARLGQIAALSARRK
jgi:nitrite reductase (cytochrome c-552)